MWLVATVLGRTVLDAGNKTAKNIGKVPVFVKLKFYSREDTENDKNNTQD